MAEQTLEELKASNALEKDESTPAPQADEEATDDEVVDDELENAGDPAEGDEDDEGKAETEDWMKGDTDDDDDGGQPSSAKFNDSDMAKARRKYKAKIAKQDDAMEQLRRENEELKKPRRPATQLHEPRREDFDGEADPQGAFTSAMVDYRISKQQAENQASDQATRRQQEFNERQAKVGSAVDKHYERAVKLSEESGITAEMYQNADFRLRSMVESVFNPDRSNDGAGDAIVDALIANLGDGSEKVMYNLGVNSSRLQELKTRFENDRSGVSASIYIGQLNAELSAPKKRKTNAPKPAPNVKGDKHEKAQTKAYKKAYDDADKKGDTQARFNARREARKAGVDTSNW